MGIPYAEVIGDPIAHSKSPLIHKYWLGKLGMEGDYRATLVPAEALGAYFEERRLDPDWRGCNITMPHKMTARAYAAHQTDPSFPAEPINLAVREPDGSLTGYAFDAAGFIEPLIKLPDRGDGLPRPVIGGSSGPAVVIGAGSAARAVIRGLSVFGYAPIWIVNRSRDKAEKVAMDYRPLGTKAIAETEIPPGVRLLVNASAMGMAGRPDPFMPFDSLDPNAIVYDVVYAPLETSLLREARARSFRTIDGLSMLIGQADPAFRALFAAAAPREYDSELRELLTP